MSTADSILVPEYDRIQSVQDVPLWSENLVLQVNDSAAEISVWAHWGRIPERPEIWEGIVTCYLPGGEVLTSRTFAGSPHSDAACSGPATFQCVEPLRR